MRIFSTILTLGLVTGGATIAAASEVPAASVAASKVTPAQAKFFETAIRPLLVEHCYDCHNEDEQSGSLRLDSRGHMLLGGDSGPAIVPKDSAGSLLMEAVRYESYEMPPSGQLPADQIELLERWIDMGAPWPGAADEPEVRRASGPQFSEDDRNWWAIQPVESPVVPTPENEAWCRSDIDRFVLARLEAENMHPAPQADPVALLRRVCFDLTGLPPTEQQIARVAGSEDFEATYEAIVDELIASPAYGERQARHWLDLVRYADSDGYKNDHYRPKAWRYRDYVIDAFNGDKPYDRFVKEQLAADELYPDSPKLLVALGYLRNGIYEHNSRDVVGQYDLMLNELTDTTGDVFLGAGMQCARCHDHKFDPILQTDYFRLRAFFEPLSFRDDLVIATPQERAAHAKAMTKWETATAAVRAELDAIEKPILARLKKTAIDRFPPEIQELMRADDDDLSPRERQLKELAWRQVDEEEAKIGSKYGRQKPRVIELKKRLASFDKLKPAPLPLARAAADVLGVRTPDAIPQTVVPKKKTEVDPGFLTLLGEREQPLETSPSILPVAADDPQIGHSTGRRAALAEWIADPSNPLSTRVIVNRLWQHHFGRGLAPNGSDFGQLGGPPTHPKLLDWLVGRLLESNWRLKPLHREIVLSATYRQSSHHPLAAAFETTDPGNDRYWRADTRRLDAEQVRDALLFATGTLQEHAGGPGANRGKPVRSIYLKVIRNKRDPLLDAFDLPQFFVSTAARDTTTSPLQSLLLINSGELLGYASAMATHAQSTAATPEDAVARAWRLAFGRPASESERLAALRFLDEQTMRIETGKENAPTMDEELRVAVGSLPYRDGDAIKLSASQPSELFVAHDDALAPESFTVEAYFQIKSIYKTGSVRAIVSKANVGTSQAGWAFGVTGEGSRRKPQTLVMHMFGDVDGAIREQAIFSDQHIELDTPYYAAASVKLADEVSGEPGRVRFYLKDLSDPNQPVQMVQHAHRIGQRMNSSQPLTIGRRATPGPTYFDGLIDHVRLTARPLDVGELLITDESLGEATVADWSLETSDGLSHDRTGNGHTIRNGREQARKQQPARRQAFIDFCHVLLNASEFLYVY